MTFDRQIYFALVRESLFGGALSQEQVDGQNVILSLWEWQSAVHSMRDLRWLAYMLATVFHECAGRMWPIEEYGKGEGHTYGVPDPETGQTYYGRGFVQLTWRENYRNATVKLSLAGDRDLEWHPERALDCLTAGRVLFRGMAEGWFTGAKLADYFSVESDDPVNARQIVNGNDCDTLIAEYYEHFLTALESAVDMRFPVPAPLPEVVRVHVYHGSPLVEVEVAVNGKVMVAS